jgi:uncharacterized low-complexity protein
MSKKIAKPLTLAIGAAFIGSMSLSPAALASSTFDLNDLDAGYMLASDHGKDREKGKEGKCGEGKCGEGKCGEDKEKEKGEEGKCGEGKCGEGKCGEDKGEEGKCGEGKCGEGKCGSL